MSNNRLYISNLSKKTTQDDLYELFAAVGTVISARIATHHITGAHKGYGFVEMETNELAKAAVAGVNHSALHDREIYVTIIRPPGERHRLLPEDAASTGPHKRANSRKGKRR